MTAAAASKRLGGTSAPAISGRPVPAAGPSATAAAVELVRLGPLLAETAGSAAVGVALVDGPVAADHPDLAEAAIHSVTGDGAACARSGSGACRHGTFVAGVLVARRSSPAPALCPGCTLLVRPIFREAAAEEDDLPAASPEEVAAAIVECVDAGARVVNLSAATGAPTTRAHVQLRRALDHAARHGVLVVAAAGNQGSVGSSEIVRHPGVVPVVGYDLAGRPLDHSNLSGSAGRRGVGAPGAGIVSLAAGGGYEARSGTSFAAAFVSGTLALLWSRFPDASAGALRHAVSGPGARTTVIPPLLDARAARRALGASAA